MNFSIHLDERTAAALKREAARTRRPRNALVAEAIRRWLEHSQPTQWPAELLEFDGSAALKPFEQDRPKKNERARFP